MTAPEVLVSVVVPTFRDSRYVLEAVDSICAQSMTDWEAIVVDDGSDPVIQNDLARHFAALADKRVRFVASARNRGAARNRNLGIRLARGRYLAFLDGDDLWLPDKLHQQLAEVNRTGAGFCCTAYENFNLETGATSVRVPPARITYDELLRRNSIGCSTVLIDRDRIGRVRFPDIAMRQDYALWLALLRPGREAVGLATPLTRRRIHGRSLSSNKLRAMRYTWRMYRDVEGLGVAQAAACFTHNALGGISRRLRGVD